MITGLVLFSATLTIAGAIYIFMNLNKPNIEDVAKYIRSKVYRTPLKTRCTKKHHDKYHWVYTFELGVYEVEYQHHIKGDLIIIRSDGESVLEYVDQYRAYGGWVGLNDIQSVGNSIEDIYNLIYNKD